MSVRSDEAGVVPPVAPAVLRDERPGLDATTTEPVTAAVKVG